MISLTHIVKYLNRVDLACVIWPCMVEDEPVTKVTRICKKQPTSDPAEFHKAPIPNPGSLVVIVNKRNSPSVIIIHPRAARFVGIDTLGIHSSRCNEAESKA